MAKPVDAPLSFESPESSFIVRADYNPGVKELQVLLNRGGKLLTYLHAGVPMDVWEEFSTSASKGSIYNTLIRPLYAGKQL